MGRNQNVQIPLDTTIHQVPEGISKYKVQENWTLQQACKSGLYTDYTLTSEEHSTKKKTVRLRKAKASILQELKNEMQQGEILRTVTRHYFKVPLSTAHRAHPVGEACTVGHSLQAKIASKIHELVSENITNADVVRKCLEQYAEKEMFGGPAAHQKPKRSNRRYYPSRQDVRSHIADCQGSKCH